MAPSKRSVALNIAGIQLSLKTDREEEALQELTEYVGSQVELLRAAAPTASTQKICMLVALKLADELFAEREANRALTDEVLSRSHSILDVLDAEIGSAQASPN
jgi:cell division protein ZapA (FtsZ GTPase activity inhibitor)